MSEDNGWRKTTWPDVGKELIFWSAIIALALILCSCAPYAGHGAVGHAGSVGRAVEATDAVPRDSIAARVPWSPNDRPVRIYVLNMERGIYHGYWNDNPFLWAYQARGRYVLDFHVMTGATLPAIPCTIELRRTDGRP